MDERTISEEEARMREELRRMYGGHMTLTDVARELGMKYTYGARGFVKNLPATRVNNRLRWPTGAVARRLIECREKPCEAGRQ
ncbi:MAG: hypothetical protein IKD89_07780 [Clostridia bacterium]|nr:hypothetical protein [Clostridia bacterium]